MFEFAIFCFVSLFSMVNPFGTAPVFISMTADLSQAQARKVAFKASLTALVCLVLIAWTGESLFELFSISINSLRIVGGIVLILVGYEMLQAKLSRTKHDEESMKEYINDLAITPLGIPILCGPGAMAMVIILMNESDTVLKKASLMAAIVSIIALVFLSLVSAKRIMKLLGESGNKVLMRLMGLIVMLIAVEFFFSGLKPFLRDILMIG